MKWWNAMYFVISFYAKSRLNCHIFQCIVAHLNAPQQIERFENTLTHSGNVLFTKSMCIRPHSFANSSIEFVILHLVNHNFPPNANIINETCNSVLSTQMTQFIHTNYTQIFIFDNVYKAYLSLNNSKWIWMMHCDDHGWELIRISFEFV